MSKPLVSFICPTYGCIARQPDLMEDMLYWYTQQDYPNTEMVILNDADNQVLTSSVPGVRVYNVPRVTMPSLGYKMNALIELAKGEIICIWEDDDFHLPWRASQAVQMLKGYDFWNPGQWGYWYVGFPMQGCQKGEAGLHTSCAWRRSVMRNLYPNLTQGHDQHAVHYSIKNFRMQPYRITHPKEISLVYCWNRSQYHLSGHGDMEEAYRNAPTGPGGNYDLKAVKHTEIMDLYHQMVANYEQTVATGVG